MMKYLTGLGLNKILLNGMKRLLPVLTGFALLLLSSTEGWSLPPCIGTYTYTTWTGSYMKIQS
jgi:hypothetical protein